LLLPLCTINILPELFYVVKKKEDIFMH